MPYRAVFSPPSPLPLSHSYDLCVPSSSDSRSAALPAAPRDEKGAKGTREARGKKKEHAEKAPRTKATHAHAVRFSSAGSIIFFCLAFSSRDRKPTTPLLPLQLHLFFNSPREAQKSLKRREERPFRAVAPRPPFFFYCTTPQPHNHGHRHRARAAGARDCGAAAGGAAAATAGARERGGCRAHVGLALCR